MYNIFHIFQLKSVQNEYQGTGMLTYPNIDPVAVALGPLQVHWYGLMYLLAFLCAWGLATYRAKQRNNWNADMVSDLVF